MKEKYRSFFRSSRKALTEKLQVVYVRIIVLNSGL
jgi:hypothetical protein